MNQDNLRLWIDDLETTTEPQTRGTMTDDNGDCCLGRLCKVAMADGVNLTVEQNALRNALVYNGIASTPPMLVSQWLGLAADGILHSASEARRFYSECVSMNDGHDMSFKEIASVLRERYLAQ